MYRRLRNNENRNSTTQQSSSSSSVASLALPSNVNYLTQEQINGSRSHFSQSSGSGKKNNFSLYY